MSSVDRKEGDSVHLRDESLLKMRLHGLLTVSGVISIVLAFSDTAPLLYFPPIAGLKLAVPFDHHYIVEAVDLYPSIEQFSKASCQANEHLIIYRVHGLLGSLAHDPNSTSGSDSSPLAINNVHYSSLKMAAFPLDNSCSLSGPNPQVSVIDIYDHNILQFTPKQNSHVLVQGVPPFHSTIQDVREYVKEIIDIDVFHKRQASPELEALDSSDIARLTMDVEQELEAAEELVLVEPDAPENGLGISRAELNQTLVNRNPNLFTNYQFFTPGIWMCAIVSGLMIGVLYVALKWITSVEISYGAFEKQVDWQKKNE